jgi:H+/Cl- antiporter ClcA
MAPEPKRKRSVLTPAIGLLIAIILGVIAWMVAPDLIHWLALTLPNFAGNELPLSISRPLFTAIIVLLSLIAVGLTAALLAPKDGQQTRAVQLEKDREALRRRQRTERAQARKPKGSK